MCVNGAETISVGSGIQIRENIKGRIHRIRTEIEASVDAPICEVANLNLASTSLLDLRGLDVCYGTGFLGWDLEVWGSLHSMSSVNYGGRNEEK